MRRLTDGEKAWNEWARESYSVVVVPSSDIWQSSYLGFPFVCFEKFVKVVKGARMKLGIAEFVLFEGSRKNYGQQNANMQIKVFRFCNVLCRFRWYRCRLVVALSRSLALVPAT